jgi:hypothetical protein
MSAMVYHGYRDAGGTAHVDADDAPLRLRLDLWNHSPTGFEWGYGGSGPAQLALALLADALGDDARAVRLHQRFKWEIVARLERDEEWELSVADVREVAADLTEQDRRAVRR